MHVLGSCAIAHVARAQFHPDTRKLPNAQWLYWTLMETDGKSRVLYNSWGLHVDKFVASWSCQDLYLSTTYITLPSFTYQSILPLTLNRTVLNSHTCKITIWILCFRFRKCLKHAEQRCGVGFFCLNQLIAGHSPNSGHLSKSSNAPDPHNSLISVICP